MSRVPGLAVSLLLFPILAAAAPGGSPGPADPPVPRLMRFTGVAAGCSGPVAIVFALYADQSAETPLWSERQRVLADESGRYTVHLGAGRSEGLPTDLFASGEARWLGVRVEGQSEQARVLLVSVPYALKAADAETIGGRPISAFVLAGETTGVGPDGLTYVDARVLTRGLGAAGPAPQAAGTPNYVGMFTSTTELGNSVIYQNGTSIGVGTTAPFAAFHALATAAPGAIFDVYSNSLGALPVVYRAARGTPASPAAVQTDDILGGLAVRGYGATAFSSGRGQVMFKAAEPWTDAANGTYLQFTTTPIGSSTWVERIRITPAGNVGIGTLTPAQRLSVAGTVESTAGGFRFPDGTTQTTALTLGANIFTATQTLSAGNIVMPATTSASSGVLVIGGQSFLHGGGAVANPNTFVGPGAGNFTGGGVGGNTGVGALALANVAGEANTAVGYSALGAVTAGSWNTAVGAAALSVSTGQGNSAFGAGALRSTTTGGNSAFGAGSLITNTTGQGNSAFGSGSLYGNTDAHDNSAFGDQSLYTNINGTSNSAFGADTMWANVNGSYNVAVGTLAMRYNTAGSCNSAVGRSALVMNNGNYNAAFGYQSLVSNTTGYENTAIGGYAGGYVTVGYNNTFVGYGAATDATHGGITNATAIGANAVVTRSDSLVLGPTGTGAVNVGIGTTAPDTTLQVVGDIKVGSAFSEGCVKNFDGSALVGTCSSDARLKDNIRPFEPVLDRLTRLRPVHFTWKADQFPEYHFGTGLSAGLIAQQVEREFPEMVTVDARGYRMVRYSELPYLTLAAVQELKALNDGLSSENAALRAQLAALAERLTRLERQTR